MQPDITVTGLISIVRNDIRNQSSLYKSAKTVVLSTEVGDTLGLMADVLTFYLIIAAARSEQERWAKAKDAVNWVKNRIETIRGMPYSAYPREFLERARINFHALETSYRPRKDANPHKWEREYKSTWKKLYRFVEFYLFRLTQAKAT